MRRALRTVRPLRTLRFVPGMSTLITSLLGSLPQLGTVAGLCAFVFLVFGIVGEQLFQGALHYRCAPQAAQRRWRSAQGACMAPLTRRPWLSVRDAAPVAWRPPRPPRSART